MFKKGWGQNFSTIVDIKHGPEVVNIEGVTWLGEWVKDGPCMHRTGYFSSPLLRLVPESVEFPKEITKGGEIQLISEEVQPIFKLWYLPIVVSVEPWN